MLRSSRRKTKNGRQPSAPWTATNDPRFSPSIQHRVDVLHHPATGSLLPTIPGAGFLIVAAIVVRLALIFVFKGGGYDLRIYYYFGGLLLSGANPYRAPIDGVIDPKYADMTPLNIGIFALILLIWNSRLSLRLAFVLVDAAILIWLARTRSATLPSRRLLFLFYGFNPLLLLAWTVATEDKAIVFGLQMALLMSLTNGHNLRSAVSCALLAGYKFLGYMFLLPVLLYVHRNSKQVVLLTSVMLLIIVLSHAPFWADIGTIYSARLDRASLTSPIHASPLIILKAIRISGRYLATIIMTTSVFGLYILNFRRSISTPEAIAGTSFVVSVFGAESGIDRLLLGTLPLFLFFRPTRARVIGIWGLSCTAALALLCQLGPPQWVGLERDTRLWLDHVFGEYGSLKHALFMNALPFVCIGFCIWDRMRTR